MTIAHGFLLLFLIGLAYSLWHLRVALQQREALGSQNGLLQHVAIGDVRTALKDVLVGLMLVLIVALPLAIEFIGLPWFRLLQQLAFILLGVVYVLGMAFARLHQLKQP